MSDVLQTAPLAAPLDINEIQKILPHRYPFLLVDRVLELSEKRVVGQKCVTMNEWFFQGHFPQQPVMPGVLIIEGLAQTAAILAHMQPENAGRLVYLAAVDEARFRRVVSPGDVLRYEIDETYRRRTLGRASAKAFVGDDLATEATITFMVEQK